MPALLFLLWRCLRDKSGPAEKRAIEQDTRGLVGGRQTYTEKSTEDMSTVLLLLNKLCIEIVD